MIMVMGIYALAVLLVEVIWHLPRRRVDLRKAKPVGNVLGWLVVRVSVGMAFALTMSMVLGTVQGLRALQRLDLDTLTTRLGLSLKTRKENPILFDRLDGSPGFFHSTDTGVTGLDGEPFLKARARFVPMKSGQGDFEIHVFGGSTVISPGFDEAFPALLEKRLNDSDERFHVFNFGTRTLDSAGMMKRAFQAMEQSRPDLLILYTDHTDYSQAYREIIKPGFFLIGNSPILRELLEWYYLGFHRPIVNFVWDSRDDPAFPEFLESRLEPFLNHWLQFTGLLNVHKGSFLAFDALIGEAAKKNLTALLKMARKARIPVVIVTPVANLGSRPYGIDGQSTEFFEAGQVEKRYRDRIELLMEARNGEAFSHHVRAKPDMKDWLLTRKGSQIHVLDLESALMERRFGFDELDFYDPIHMEPSTHSLVAELLFDFLAQRRICCGLEPATD